jgi:P27 family predicted phage terminase small subunit
MPVRGSKPVPTKLRILRGNPRQHALPKNEPKPPSGIPDPPEHLTPEAREHWDEVREPLAKIGLLTVIDGEALAGYCESRALWVAAKKKLAEQGITVSSPNGYEIPSPSLSIAMRAQKEMRAWLAEFGMTPSSRSRVKAGEPGEASDPFEDLLKSA